MRRHGIAEKVLSTPGRALSAGKDIIHHMPGVSRKPERMWNRRGFQVAAGIGAAAVGVVTAAAYALRRRVGSEQPVSQEWHTSDAAQAAAHPSADGAVAGLPPAGEMQRPSSSLM